MCDMRKAAHYASFYRAAKRITEDAARLAFYDALDAYRFDGVMPDFDNMPVTAAIALEAIMPNIDADMERKQGGAPKGNSNAKKQVVVDFDALREANEEPAEKTTRFQKPSVEQVAEYCKERNNGIDAQAFVDFYESKGWKIGNNPMKDWRAAVRTWEKRKSAPAPAAQALPENRITF